MAMTSIHQVTLHHSFYMKPNAMYDILFMVQSNDFILKKKCTDTSIARQQALHGIVIVQSNDHFTEIQTLPCQRTCSPSRSLAMRESSSWGIIHAKAGSFLKLGLARAAVALRVINMSVHIPGAVYVQRRNATGPRPAGLAPAGRPLYLPRYHRGDVFGTAGYQALCCLGGECLQMRAV